MQASPLNRFMPREQERALQSVADIARSRRRLASRGGLTLPIVLAFGCGNAADSGPDGGTSATPDGGEAGQDAAPGSPDAGPPEAEPTWSMLLPEGAAPAPRANHAMAYDESRERLVVFGGGILPSSAAGDTWEWDGASWETREPNVSPPPRRYHAMAYDADREQVVLYGGFGGDFYGDTWVWDGNEWAEVTPETSPNAHFNHRMVYDAARSEIVLFGGAAVDFEAGGTERLDETWVWDGASWTQKVGLPTSPPARTGFGMSYDPVRERVVLFGGFRGGQAVEENYLYDTWEWDGSRWSRISTDGQVPAGPSHAQLAYDPTLEATILFGGQVTYEDEDGEFVSDVFDDTWAFDGSSWEKLGPAESPPANAGHELVNDSDDHILLYGGRTGTLWTWK